MKTLLILLSILFFSGHVNAQDKSSAGATTYYLIRHAEKDRSDPTVKDMHLDDNGKLRAERWSNIFEQVAFDAIYATDYKRTKETVEPTAIKKGLQIISYDPKNPFTSDFEAATKGKTVLIVGHSNTIPDFVNAIIGKSKYEDIDDANNGNLYIITILKDGISDILLTIN